MECFFSKQLIRKYNMSLTIKDAAVLHNGVKMPWLGLGVFNAGNGKEVRRAIEIAIANGYRSIDTAKIYGNEVSVGEAIAASAIARDELFITTKVWNSDQGYDSTLRAFEQSERRLDCDYIDLYLVHWPVQGLYKDTWRALEKLYENGRVRAIGVSNFMVHHLQDLLADCSIVPMVNQVEFHPRLVQHELRSFCGQHKIQFESWSPLMRGAVLSIPEIQAIAEGNNKTVAQVVLRWNLQHGVVTIPKSVNHERIIENAGIFDFDLSDEEMTEIDALDQDQRVGPDPDNFNF
jgi:diketogulonate reductase-like aldo/keto reductase